MPLEQSHKGLLRVFVASPGDVTEERQRLATVVEGLNRVFTDHLGLTLRLEEWSHVAPRMGRVEDVILSQIPVESWDIFVGILWLRFGMRTGSVDPITGKKFESGTEEEFKLAYRLWKETQKPHIMFYRCTRPPATIKLDHGQLRRVEKFFRQFDPSKGDHPGLYKEFDTSEKFERLVREHLEKFLLDYSKQIGDTSTGKTESTLPPDRVPESLSAPTNERAMPARSAKTIRPASPGIGGWLGAHGFRANPFADLDAALEEENLERCFVPGSDYDEIKGVSTQPHSCFVFALRGYGKTAYRMMIQRECQPGRADSDVLAVAYTQTELNHVLEEMKQSATKTTLEQHLNAILRIAVTNLLQALETNSEHIQLDRDDYPGLIWFAQQYAPDHLDVETIWNHLKGLPGIQADDRAAITKAIKERRLGAWLQHKKTILAMRHIVLSELVDTAPRQPEHTQTTFDAFRMFVALVRRTALKAVYILVDEVDRVPNGAEFILPLVSNSDVLQVRGAAFKFFLPSEQSRVLAPHVRFDLFPRYELKPSAEDLREMLRRRLRTYHRRGIQSLGELAKPGLAHTIDELLVQRANGSPRQLLQGGAELLSAPARSDKSFPPLTKEDVQAFTSSRGAESVLRMRLDLKKRVVLIGDQPIQHQPRRKEFDLLSFLYERAGEPRSKKAIEDALGQDESAVYQTVSRARKSIEPDPKTPTYLVSTGDGYRLANTDRESS